MQVVLSSFLYGQSWLTQRISFHICLSLDTNSNTQYNFVISYQQKIMWVVLLTWQGNKWSSTPTGSFASIVVEPFAVNHYDIQIENIRAVVGSTIEKYFSTWDLEPTKDLQYISIHQIVELMWSVEVLYSSTLVKLLNGNCLRFSTFVTLFSFNTEFYVLKPIQT